MASNVSKFYKGGIQCKRHVSDFDADLIVDLEDVSVNKIVLVKTISYIMDRTNISASDFDNIVKDYYTKVKCNYEPVDDAYCHKAYARAASQVILEACIKIGNYNLLELLFKSPTYAHAMRFIRHFVDMPPAEEEYDVTSDAHSKNAFALCAFRMINDDYVTYTADMTPETFVSNVIFIVNHGMSGERREIPPSSVDYGSPEYNEGMYRFHHGKTLPFNTAEGIGEEYVKYFPRETNPLADDLYDVLVRARRQLYVSGIVSAIKENFRVADIKKIRKCKKFASPTHAIIAEAIRKM